MNSFSQYKALTLVSAVALSLALVPTSSMAGRGDHSKSYGHAYSQHQGHSAKHGKHGVSHSQWYAANKHHKRQKRHDHYKHHVHSRYCGHRGTRHNAYNDYAHQHYYSVRDLGFVFGVHTNNFDLTIRP